MCEGKITKGIGVIVGPARLSQYPTVMWIRSPAKPQSTLLFLQLITLCSLISLCFSRSMSFARIEVVQNFAYKAPRPLDFYNNNNKSNNPIILLANHWLCVRYTFKAHSSLKEFRAL